MDDLRGIALAEQIDRQIDEKKDELVKEIIEGYKQTDSLEATCAKMVYNAIRISVRLSTGVLIDMLIELGLVDPADEEQSRKSILKIIK